MRCKQGCINSRFSDNNKIHMYRNKDMYFADNNKNKHVHVHLCTETKTCKFMYKNI